MGGGGGQFHDTCCGENWNKKLGTSDMPGAKTTVDPICFTQNFEQLLTKNLW